MTDAPDKTEEQEDRASSAVRDLVRRSLSTDTLGRDTPDLLSGVQRRIRKRSRGKFFADGWSTSQARTSYVLVGVMTLLLVALAYYTLGPMDLP
ncbi:MAG TPA: hypothetical protein VKU41_03680 [Polyangiaceae bacterium]|nr:hypothetical protein [Polyangiaceae bacterium]